VFCIVSRRLRSPGQAANGKDASRNLTSLIATPQYEARRNVATAKRRVGLDQSERAGKRYPATETKHISRKRAQRRRPKYRSALHVPHCRAMEATVVCANYSLDWLLSGLALGHESKISAYKIVSAKRCS